MTDPVTPAAPAAAAPNPAPETPAPATAPAAQEPGYIKERLDRERRAVLKDLGIKVKKDEDPSAKIEEYKASKEERRKAREEQTKELEKAKASIEKLSHAEAAVKVFAETEFNALSSEQQAIVKAAAGDDPNERLRTIAIMKATAPKTAPAAAAPIPAPAQSAPAQAAPPPASAPAAVNVREEYKRLQGVNPLAAAAYLLQNQAAYMAAK